MQVNAFPNIAESSWMVWQDASKLKMPLCQRLCISSTRRVPRYSGRLISMWLADGHVCLGSLNLEGDLVTASSDISALKGQESQDASVHKARVPSSNLVGLGHLQAVAAQPNWKPGILSYKQGNMLLLVLNACGQTCHEKSEAEILKHTQ